jgi:hypothetical protein
MTPEQLVQSVAAPIGAIGASFYFVPETLAVGKEHGVGGFQWYFVGRGGVLGDVEAPVVQAAFGYFHPEMAAKLWNAAREKIAPRVAGQRYHVCAADFGRAKLDGVDGLGAYCEAAEAVVGAAHPAGLPLFAGIAAEPLVADAPGRAYQLACVLRELRGSAHLVAVLASGLSAEQAHFLRRPNEMKSFGYDEATPPAVTDADRAALAAADKLTDKLVTPAFAALDDAGGKALAAGVAGMASALGL